MPTDDERRREAERLRECKSHIDAAGWFWLNDELGGAHVVASSEERLRRGTARLADLMEPDDPPYNLYTLYEAVFHRSPRCCECIEDDEVDELVDALLDICNAPGHERIQRLKPPYPDATAIYKGWRAEVYDPDGVLVSPSNLAVDLVRAHADGKVPSEPKVRCVAEVKVDGEQLEKLVHDAAVELTGIDRDALLELANVCKSVGDMYAATHLEPENDEISDLLREVAEFEWKTARIIRKACGEEVA